MRPAPVATVINDPQIAATRNAPPTGAFQCQPRKWMVVVSRFCAMNTNSTMRTSVPTISAHHAAAVRVNGTVALGTDVVVSSSCGSLVMSHTLRVRVGGCGDVGGPRQWRPSSWGLLGGGGGSNPLGGG